MRRDPGNSNCEKLPGGSSRQRWNVCLMYLEKKLMVSVHFGATQSVASLPVEYDFSILSSAPAMDRSPACQCLELIPGVFPTAMLLFEPLISLEGWSGKGPRVFLLTRPLISPQQYHRRMEENTRLSGRLEAMEENCRAEEKMQTLYQMWLLP